MLVFPLVSQAAFTKARPSEERQVNHELLAEAKSPLHSDHIYIYTYIYIHLYLSLSLSLSLSSPSSFIDSLLQEHVKVKVQMSAFIFKKRGDNLSLVQPTPIIKSNLVFVVINDYII